MKAKGRRTRVAAGNVVAQFSITEEASEVINELAKTTGTTRSDALMRMVSAFDQPLPADKEAFDQQKTTIEELQKDAKADRVAIDALKKLLEKRDETIKRLETNQPSAAIMAEFVAPVAVLMRGKFLDGMSVRELSEHFGVPVGWVEQALRSAI